MKRMLTLVLGSLAIGYAAILIAVYFGQDRLTYFPTNEVPPAGKAGVAGLADVEATADDGTRLHGWLLDPPAATALVVHFHGNGGDLSHRLWKLERLAKAGVGSLIIDYPGYGKSAGAPSEAGLYAAGRAAVRLAREHARGRAVAYWGESLGCAVAIETALAAPPDALILEAPFASLPAIGAWHYPWLPVRTLTRARYDNVGKVGRIRVPLLVVHGDRDRVIPIEHGRAVFAAANEPKRFHAVPGADHNDTSWFDTKPMIDAVRRAAQARGVEHLAD